MKDIKVKVLRLSGCGWCGRVVAELEKLNIEHEVLNANVEEDLADELESLLDTVLYPIIIVDRPIDTWYIFRPRDEKEINKIVPFGFKNFKVAHNTIANMIVEVTKLVK